MPTTDIHYKTFPVDSANQAMSLARYLSSHGVDAIHDGNSSDIPYMVSCPMDDDDDPAREMLVNQLRRNWKLFWEHSDAELYGLPVYRKPGCDIDQGCPYCGVGPVVR